MNRLITLFLSISLFSVLSVTQTTETNSEVLYRYPTPVPRPSVYFDNPEVKFEDLTFTKFIHYIVKKLLWVFDNLMLKDYETEIKQHNTSQMYKFRLPQETTTEEK
ncbi:hypothetical protein MS3_00011175 [Schistosoma haematobium]|uniref:Uncharacterized protein n=1 Tax=Schistosoma haematobium TaxID=6185 RepID=A0A922IHA9_SCHHA|nr:hypothetical protein MS3_00011175 [Schistosoma haematobium]KAH9579346.1 hypothetical protein MS3_00011175 [Schistosoma haematobium]CAH8632064.1 unnamed protein product [Schistosoma haematobium]CAH8638743.1 unnamed protein product [Schistosoma haematobium]